MKTIYKYKLKNDFGAQVIHLPRGYRIVYFAMQRGDFCVWAEVFPENQEETLVVTVLGTGSPVPEGYRYFGTIQEYMLVYHLYIPEDR